MTQQVALSFNLFTGLHRKAWWWEFKMKCERIHSYLGEGWRLHKLRTFLVFLDIYQIYKQAFLDLHIITEVWEYCVVIRENNSTLPWPNYLEVFPTDQFGQLSSCSGKKFGTTDKSAREVYIYTFNIIT